MPTRLGGQHSSLWYLPLGDQIWFGNPRQRPWVKVKWTWCTNSWKIQQILELKKNGHSTHLQNLVDNMCKYEIDQASIVESTEQTWFCPQADRWTDRQTRWNQFHWKRVYDDISFISYDCWHSILPYMRDLFVKLWHWTSTTIQA